MLGKDFAILSGSGCDWNRDCKGGKSRSRYKNGSQRPFGKESGKRLPGALRFTPTPRNKAQKIGSTRTPSEKKTNFREAPDASKFIEIRYESNFVCPTKVLS